MTLLSAYRATKVLGLAVVLAAGGMTAADAGGRRHHHHQHDHSARLRYVPHLDNAFGGRASSVLRYGGNHDRQARDRNFYGGAFTAYRDSGGSLYFYADEDGVIARSERRTRRTWGGPKVITVTPGNYGCSWEAGVCVIRPRW